MIPVLIVLAPFIAGLLIVAWAIWQAPEGEEIEGRGFVRKDDL